MVCQTCVHSHEDFDQSMHNRVIMTLYRRAISGKDRLRYNLDGLAFAQSDVLHRCVISRYWNEAKRMVRSVLLCMFMHISTIDVQSTDQRTKNGS